jgi:hypothetical protein
MTYENMKKAAQIAAVSMSSPAVPVVGSLTNRSGRKFYRGDEFVYDGPLENPIEVLAGRRDEALARVREGQGLLERAQILFQLASRAPYYAGFAARPTPQELAEIRAADQAITAYSTALAAAMQQLEIATTRLNLKLMGMAANSGVEPE